MPETEVIESIRAEIASFIQNISVSKPNRISIHVDKANLKRVVEFSVNKGFSHLSAITALNNDDHVEVLYHLSGGGVLMTVRITLSPGDDSVPTITDIIPGALLHEREVHDLFGVKFEGHPDLRPLLLPENWPENIHPMRKSRAIER